MAGGRLKSGVKHKKNKGKRWKKGHSSESNPELKRNRLAAKNRFFNQNTGSSGLTQAALAKHNQETDSDGDVVLGGGDAGSVGGKTFQTWATNWTECTNTTFSRVHRYWTSNSAMHKEILAVLAAVTEVIKVQGGKETETEYFAALMTSLETLSSNDESLAAVAYLLSLVIKRVPVSVLKAKFSDVAKVLLNLLATHADAESGPLLRSLLMCLASLLRIQDPVVWSDASTVQVYKGMLMFTTHHKPKVRKAAHHAVCVILKGSSFMTQGDPPPHHPAANTTAKHCVQQIEEAGGSNDSSATLYTLGLLKDILGILPHHSVKSVCETILRLMTLSNVLISSLGMQALYGMFSSQPKATNLPAELNAQIITALYDFMPGENDAQPLLAWLAVMEKAYMNLNRLDDKLCVSHLPRIFTTCMKCLLSDKREVGKGASSTLQVLLKECITPNAERLGVMVQSAPGGMSTPVNKMFKTVEQGLSYQYHAVWSLVLPVIGVFFDVLGKQCPQIMKKCLLSMADLRDSHQFAYKVELDDAVGTAIKRMGPKQVLDAVPLQITGEEDNYDFPRSWLLPVLRENIMETELGYFTSYFLPLAAKLRVKSVEYAAENRIVECKTYDALQLQIWSLLTGFCTKATDITKSFRGIAKVLGSAISDRPDLRHDVMASLRTLINQSLDSAEDRAEIAKFAKNFLPILFNLFTSDTESERDPSRLAVLETIKCYIQITDKQLVGSMFDKISSKMSETDISPLRRHALMDLTISMVPYVDSKRLKIIYRLVVSQLESIDKTIQKKSYRVLEEMCAGKSDESRDFVKSTLEELETVVLQSLSSSSPSSKAPRLRCLVHIFKHLETPSQKFLVAVVPEAILCTKETAERARLAAYNLLIEMGNAMIRWSDQSIQDVIQEYFSYVIAGLAGSPHMVSATVLALTRILYQFKAQISSQVLGVLVEQACLLLSSKAREIVQSALGFVKVLLASFKDIDLAQYLKSLVTSLVQMKEDNRHHFRFKAKEIFGRLIRKFGYETILNMVPDSHHKLLINIKKTQERAKKQKKKREEEEEEEEKEEETEFKMKVKTESVDELLRDTDSELEGDGDDDQKTSKTKKKVKRSKSGLAWLQEGGEGDIVDFLDPGVSKKVLATKPEIAHAEGKEKKPHGFKMAADGRLIITEEKEEPKPKKVKPGTADDLEDLDDLLDAMEGPGKKSRKRRLEDHDDDDEAPAKYKAGGTGIHRPLGGQKKEETPGKEFRAKKAGGDVKQKGKHDPYAYVPLDFRHLNKRKRAKAAGQFKGFVRSARKGAVKGQKQKTKKGKK